MKILLQLNGTKQRQRESVVHTSSNFSAVFRKEALSTVFCAGHFADPLIQTAVTPEQWTTTVLGNFLIHVISHFVPFFVCLFACGTLLTDPGTTLTKQKCMLCCFSASWVLGRPFLLCFLYVLFSVWCGAMENAWLHSHESIHRGTLPLHH